ncbi:Cytochrome b5-related protein [Blattella germanica]|nr:Cytochrome b5-related protein [Blattella germanica]
MAPREMYPSLIPKYPSFRDDAYKSPTLWIKGKQLDDGAEGLWRIHDELYDFSRWIKNHPGGSDWLDLTKGTDITEAFESHHITLTPTHLLKHFHVRSATTPRNSPYTFHENGFYRTLQKRVREHLKGKPPSVPLSSKLIIDFLCGSTLILAILAARYSSYFIGALSGYFLALTIIAAHNFFHQKDNFRMYYFDLSLMSSRDWRISHALSHHIYTNSVMDLELSLFEPVFQFLPDPAKPAWARYGPLFYAPLIYSIMYMVEFFTRIRLIRKGYKDSLTKEDLIPLIIPALMLIGSDSGFFSVILMWIWIILVSGFFFGSISLNGAHHHPEIFHDGDAPREDKDWGLAQLDAVRDRPAISSNSYLALTNFGHHGLHHMFPTCDHGNLPQFYPIFKKTCKEFGVHFPDHGIVELYKGQFLQIARNEPNHIPPGSE